MHKPTKIKKNGIGSRKKEGEIAKILQNKYSTSNCPFSYQKIQTHYTFIYIYIFMHVHIVFFGCAEKTNFHERERGRQREKCN